MQAQHSASVSSLASWYLNDIGQVLLVFGCLPHRRRPAAHICCAALLGPSTHARKRRITIKAAAAASSATPAPQSNPQSRLSRLLGWLPDKQSLQLVSDAWTLLYRNLWTVVAMFLAKDAAAFVLHRLVHRLTNHSEYNTTVLRVSRPCCLQP